MKSVACKDVSGFDCEYIAEADTSEEVKAALAQHGAEAHADEMEAMEPDEAEQMTAKIDEALATQE